METKRKINMLKGVRDGCIALAIWIMMPVLVGLAAQQPPAQTPTQLLDQISGLVKQLQALLVPAPISLVKTADELTAALLKCGDILVGPGTFVGNFVVTPACPTRLTGSGRGLTIIEPKDRLQPPLAGYAVRDVLVQSLTVKNGAPDRDTVVFGTIAETDVEKQPKRVVLRDISVEAGATGGHRGVIFNGTDMTLTDSFVLGFGEKGRDAQAFAAVNGPGPYTITNNVLEGSGENILFGGADPGIPGVVPRNIVIRGNTLRKPQSWRGVYTVKNLLELKSAEEALIEDNILDGNWIDGQSGHSIVLSVRNQDGKCTQCIVNKVVIRRNELLNAKDGFAVNILGYDDNEASQQTREITIDRNLFRDSAGGVMVINGVADSLIVTNNTWPGITGRFLQWDKSSSRPKVMTPLVFSRNALKAGAYGIMGDGSTGPGLASLLAYATVKEWNGNFIERHPDRSPAYPTTGVGNVLLAPGGLAPLLDPKTLKMLTGVAGY